MLAAMLMVVGMGSPLLDLAPAGSGCLTEKQQSELRDRAWEEWAQVVTAAAEAGMKASAARKGLDAAQAALETCRKERESCANEAARVAQLEEQLAQARLDVKPLVIARAMRSAERVKAIRAEYPTCP